MKKIVLFISLVLTGITFINAQVWNQIGNDLNGAENEHFGKTISSSSNGKIMAVGAPYKDGGGTAGFVEVFQENNGNWVQLGERIKGIEIDDWFGESISLNTNGNVLAIGGPKFNGSGVERGYVQIYSFTNGDWKQIGNKIVGLKDQDQLGKSVSISDGGNIVAIGLSGNAEISGQGHVQVYRNVNESWKKIGENIKNSKHGSGGYATSINADGSIIAYGSPYAMNNDGLYYGCVSVYKNIGNVWKQIGNTICGGYGHVISAFGSSIDLNSNGLVLAIGDCKNDFNADDSGQVKVYRNIADDWEQIGSFINGVNKYDNFGRSLSLNDIGDVLLVGAASRLAFNSAGYIKVYKNEDDVWHQEGNTIHGAGWEQLGFSVDIDATGRIIAVGGDGHIGNCLHCGVVRVYENKLPIISQQPSDKLDMCVDDEVQFSVAGSMIDTYSWEVKLKNSNIWSILFNEDEFQGVASNTLTVTAKKYLNKANFRCRVANNFGEVVSDKAQLVLEKVKPTISCVAVHYVEANSGNNTYIVQGNEFDPIATADNCEVEKVVNNKNYQSSLANYSFGVGTHYVYWYVFDTAGNYNYRRITIHVSKQTFKKGKIDSNIQSLNVLGFSAYPNPTQGYVDFDIKEASISRLVVTDLSGKTILIKTNLHKQGVDLSNLKKGTYIIQLGTDKGYYTTKIIKE